MRGRGASQPCAGSSTQHPGPPAVSFKNELHVKNPGNLRRPESPLMGAIAAPAIIRIVALLQPLNLAVQFIDLLLDSLDAPVRFVSGLRAERRVAAILRRAERL